MEVFECSTFAVWSTARLSMSPQAKMIEVCAQLFCLYMRTALTYFSVDQSGGRMSPTLAQQTMSHPPPLLRLATSPHDTHLLATFAQDSNIIRILDVRQPGQALLELRGHGGAINCVEWSPLRRGTLASGADDCQILLWDLMSNNSTLSSGPAINGAPQPDNSRSPVATWQCDYEVGNLGWVPHLSSNDYGEWLGVSAGRGVWGIRL
jgi:DDB1- and CUL4-associated factor 7